MNEIFLTSLIGFLVVAVTIPFACKAAISIGFVDAPGGRKHHETPVPPIGGLIVFPLFIMLMIFSNVNLFTYWSLLASILILLITGGLDDYRGILPWPKFSAQIIAATLIVVVGDARLYHLGNLFGFGDFGLDFMSIPFSITATVLLINAVNLMDGLDGLAGGYGLVGFLFLVLASTLSGNTTILLPASILSGCLLGFLFHNMRSPFTKKARVFLGDAGSMVLGVCIAWFTMFGVRDPDPIVEPVSIAWILALPIMDTCAQFYRRMKNGRHPFSPDRGHFHHHFIDAGYSAGQATLYILMIVCMLSAIGYFGIRWGCPAWILTTIWICMLFTHIGISYKPERYIKLLTRT